MPLNKETKETKPGPLIIYAILLFQETNDITS